MEYHEITKLDEDNEDRTSLVLQNEYGTYRVLRSGTDQTIEELRDDFIIPILYQAGYTPETIKSIFKDEETQDIIYNTSL